MINNDMTAFPTRGAGDRSVGWVIVATAAACLLAWFVLFRRWLPVADDFPFASNWRDGAWRFFVDLLSQRGLRRTFAWTFMAWICGGPSWLTYPVTVCFHLATAILVGLTSGLVSGSARAGLVLGTFFAVFFGGFGAVVWACGAYVIPMSICFLGVVCLTCMQARQLKSEDWWVSGSVAVISMLCCLLGEHLVFAVMLAGPFAIAVTEHARGDWASALRRPWVWSPAVVAVGYLSFVFAWETFIASSVATHGFDVAKINLRTVFSVWWHQLRYFEFFDLWTTSGAWRVALSTWAPWMFFAWVPIAVLTGCLGWWALRACPAEQGKWRAGPWAVVAAVGFMLGFSGVHCLAGGYSAPSRHQYVAIVLLVILAATILAAMPRWRAWLERRAGWVLAAILAACVPTTWLAVGNHEFEARRYDALVSFLRREGVTGKVRLTYEPALYAFWPMLGRQLSHGFDDSWVINLALGGDLKNPVEVVKSHEGREIRVVWDGRSTAVAFGESARQP